MSEFAAQSKSGGRITELIIVNLGIDCASLLAQSNWHLRSLSFCILRSSMDIHAAILTFEEHVARIWTWM